MREEDEAGCGFRMCSHNSRLPDAPSLVKILGFKAHPSAPSSNAAAKELKEPSCRNGRRPRPNGQEKRKMKRLKELRKRFGALSRMAFSTGVARWPCKVTYLGQSKVKK